MTARRLRVGVIGLGIGQQHVAAFRAHQECDVVAVVDVDPAKLRDAAGRWPGVECHDEPKKVTDDPDVDIVCVASPDHIHHSQIIRALDHGKHVFAEKPLCTAESQTRDVWQALSRSSHLRLSSNTILRRSRRFMDLRERIARAELGRIYHIEADYNYGRLSKLTDGWRGRIPDYSVMLGGGVHMVDLVRWLTGQKVIEVSAYGCGISSQDSDFRGNDLAVAILRFDDGSVGKVGANFGSVEPHFHRLMVYGTAGTFENTRDAGLLYRSRDPESKPESIPTDYPGVGKGDLIPSFIDAVQGRGEPEVGENDVFATMAVCHAIDRSLATRRPAAVSYYGELVRGGVDA